MKKATHRKQALMIAIFLLAFTLSLFSFGTTPAAAGDVAGVSTHLFLTVLRDYDHDASFSVTYTDALGTHTKPYHAGMEVTAWSPVTITCTNHHVHDWSIDADVQEATIVGVGGITYPGGTGIHVKGTNTIKAFATNFGLHYINIVVILGEGNDNGGDNGGGTAVRSPMRGYVKRLLVGEGDYVTVGQPLLTLTQNRRLQLRADVPERCYPQLGSLTGANFRTASGEKDSNTGGRGGRLVAYGRSNADAAAYIPVTFAFDNRGDILPGSFAEVWLLAAPRQGVISLPVSALTEEQGVYFVYVQLDESCYRKQPVVTGATDGERVEIVEGLREGERVVMQGAVHVRLASASNAIPAHTHNH